MRIRCFLFFSVLVFSAGCLDSGDYDRGTISLEKGVVEITTTSTTSTLPLSSISSTTSTLESTKPPEEELKLCDETNVDVKVKSVSECSKRDLNAVHLMLDDDGVGLLKWGTANRESHFTIYCDGRKTDNHLTLYKKITDTHYSQFNLRNKKVVGEYRLDFRCNRNIYEVKDLSLCKRVQLLLSGRGYCGEATFQNPPIENRTNISDEEVECVEDSDCGRPYYSKCVCGAHGLTPKRVHYKPSCLEGKCITRFVGYVNCENGCLGDIKNRGSNLDNIVIFSPSNKSSLNLDINSIGFIVYVRNEGDAPVEDVSVIAEYHDEILLKTTPTIFNLSGGEIKKIMVELGTRRINDNETIRVWVDGEEGMSTFNVHVNETKETHVKCSLC